MTVGPTRERYVPAIRLGPSTAIDRINVPVTADGGCPGRDGVGVPLRWLDCRNRSLAWRSTTCAARPVASLVTACNSTIRARNDAASSERPPTSTRNSTAPALPPHLFLAVGVDHLRDIRDAGHHMRRHRIPLTRGFPEPLQPPPRVERLIPPDWSPRPGGGDRVARAPRS